jgi:hypothetical protein
VLVELQKFPFKHSLVSAQVSPFALPTHFLLVHVLLTKQSSFATQSSPGNLIINNKN